MPSPARGDVAVRTEPTLNPPVPKSIESIAERKSRRHDREFPVEQKQGSRRRRDHGDGQAERDIFRPLIFGEHG